MGNEIVKGTSPEAAGHRGAVEQPHRTESTSSFGRLQSDALDTMLARRDDTAANSIEKLTGFKPLGKKIDGAGKEYESFAPPKTRRWQNTDEIRLYRAEGKLSCDASRPTNEPISHATTPGTGLFAKSYKEYKEPNDLPWRNITFDASKSQVKITLANPGVVVEKKPGTNTQDRAVVYGDVNAPEISGRFEQNGNTIRLSGIGNLWGYDENGLYSSIRTAEFTKTGEGTSAVHEVNTVTDVRSEKRTISPKRYNDMADSIATMGELADLWNAVTGTSPGTPR